MDLEITNMSELTAYQRIEQLEASLSDLSDAFAEAIAQINSDFQALQNQIIETRNSLGKPGDCCE